MKEIPCKTVSQVGFMGDVDNRTSVNKSRHSKKTQKCEGKSTTPLRQQFIAKGKGPVQPRNVTA